MLIFIFFFDFFTKQRIRAHERKYAEIGVHVKIAVIPMKFANNWGSEQNQLENSKLCQLS